MSPALRVAVTLLFVGELLAAAEVDAHRRVLPNGLALALVVTAAIGCAVRWGITALMSHAVLAAAAVGGLVAFELIWRRVRGTAGQGMGDLKALFALCLAQPLLAVASYALSLAALALACTVRRVRSLPLLPFLAPTFLVMAIAARLGGYC